MQGRHVLVLTVLLVAATLWRLFLGLQLTIDADEFQSLHSAWLVGNGQVPYRDFIGMHTPGLWYMLAPLVQLFPGNGANVILGARVWGFLIACGSLAAAGLLARRLYGPSALFPTLLAASLYPPLLVWNGQVTTSTPATFFFLLSLCAAVGWLKRRPSPWDCAAAGALSMIAFWCKQAPVYPLLAALLCGISMYETRGRAGLWQAALGFGGGTLGVFVPVAAWLIRAGAFGGMVEQTVLWHLSAWFPLSPVSYLAGSLLQNPVIALLALLGLGATVAARATAASRFGLPLVTLGILLFSLSLARPAWTHFVPLYLLLCVFTMPGLAAAGRLLAGEPAVTRRVAAAALASAAVVLAVAVPLRTVGTNHQQLANVKAVLAATAPSDHVLSAIGMPFTRPHVIDHWFAPPVSVMFYRQIAAMADEVQAGNVPAVLYDPVLETLLSVPPDQILAGTRWAGRTRQVFPDEAGIRAAQERLQSLIDRYYIPATEPRVRVAGCRFDPLPAADLPVACELVVSGTYAVTVKPPGATVMMDGQPVHTPALTLAAGSHQLAVPGGESVSLTRVP